MVGRSTIDDSQRDADQLVDTAGQLRTQGDGIEIRTMVTDLVSIETAVRDVTDAVGGAPLDVLVNAAGITTRGGLDDITLADFDRLMSINVRAPLFLAQALAPGMPRGATIVNLTSMLAHGGPPFLLGYAASKSALVTLTKGIANTLKWRGVRAFGINLGWTLTPAEQQVQTGRHGLEPGCRIASLSRATIISTSMPHEIGDSTSLACRALELCASVLTSSPSSSASRSSKPARSIFQRSS